MIPLATRMRPASLDEFVGQEHFLYPGSLFYNSIKNKTFDSAIFFGPSGTGKTTLARIIAGVMDGDLHEINASVTGIKELKELIDHARMKFFGLEKRTTYIYIDEFHRWNKSQQDSLLKALEEGIIRFIGSTTENPYFSVNNAIISRVRNIYEFKRLTEGNLITLELRALQDEEKGFGALHIPYEEEALRILADLANGDARVALDTIGFIVDNLNEGEKITKQTVAEAMQRKIGFYDREEDGYNLLSALQKSIRGSDPDAAIHYFARLMDGGADIRTVGRRLLVMASEDIGMAYPSAISIVNGCVQAALMVGLPEAAINLSQAVILLASAPKSNSVISAYQEAAKDLRAQRIDDVPDYLKDSHYRGAENLGYGKDYKNPHDFGGYVRQQYLPDNLQAMEKQYYHPTENGSEAAFKKFLEGLEKLYEKDHGSR